MLLVTGISVIIMETVILLMSEPAASIQYVISTFLGKKGRFDTCLLTVCICEKFASST